MSSTGPPQQLRKIKVLEGDWDVTMDVKPDPKADWVTTAGDSRFSWILDGTVLEQTYDGSMMGRPFMGRGYLAFNRFSGKWQHTWSDNVAAILSLYEGDLVDNRLEVIGKEITPDSSFYVRVVWYGITDRKFDWVLETSMDKKVWTPMMRAVYTRKAD